MAIPTGTRFQQPDVRRRQILDAARKLAEQHGFDNASIAQVANEAGVAKGTIYLYFASRQELTAALHADVWSTMLVEPRVIAGDSSKGWAERLDALVDHWLRFELAHHELYHQVFHSHRGQARGVGASEPVQQAHAVLASILVGGQAAGVFRLTDVLTTTEVLLHALIGPCRIDGASRVDQHITALQELFQRVVASIR
ncbi:MAG: AcrR family transcriptional regulator [Candidatus Poriferisodalaceae bacterium]|jgi:TetR/AcrR family transcriptional regulator, transcriptional repressor for nem operon